MKVKKIKISRELLSEIAQDAHSRGRIYNETGEKLSPCKEFMEVEKMIDRKIWVKLRAPK